MGRIVVVVGVLSCFWRRGMRALLFIWLIYMCVLDGIFRKRYSVLLLLL
jgi:hypothetical protein